MARVRYINAKNFLTKDDEVCIPSLSRILLAVYRSLNRSVNLKVLTKNNRFHMVWDLQLYRHQYGFMINTLGAQHWLDFCPKSLYVLSQWILALLD